ncbi:MAG TPA: sigma-70 family RNA polymerase sigma factor [Stellaceae bacterium]|nr:sigma-70 family RNA polymerase sigma factor [Stellaceae bacterium]
MDEIVRLIEAEIPRLRRYARALLRDAERADDLVQDTLVRGLDKVHLFRSGDLRAWLFTIMHNQYVNTVRRAVRQREVIVVEKVTLASPASQLPNLELRDIENAIARLSAEQRETLLLVTLEGLKYEQVAQICDVPIGTVRSRLNRAREELRRMTDGTIARQGSRPSLARGEGAPVAIEPVNDTKPTN